jgi:hypothetical protein
VLVRWYLEASAIVIWPILTNPPPVTSLGTGLSSGRPISEKKLASVAFRKRDSTAAYSVFFMPDLCEMS